jgi:phosphoribosylglycinamide formyltransferase-1
MDKKIRLALFASGTGSNVFNIISHFKNSSTIEVASVLSNKTDAGALNHAKNANIETLVFDKAQFSDGVVTNYLISKDIDFVILAGFLWKIPDGLIHQFPDKIINIHPSLLPKFGGKGMYGTHVHEAVVAHKETKTGITIHLVNEHYDEGRIIKQFEVAVIPSDTVKDVAAKISVLEKTYFPKTIQEFIEK